MRDEELFGSGIFASELEDDQGADVAEPDEIDEKDLEDDDLDEVDEDEASYNPLEDYKNDEWA